MTFSTKNLVLLALCVGVPAFVSADAPPSGCSSAAALAEENGATSFNDALGNLLPSNSAAVNEATAETPQDSPVTILVPTNTALDRNTTRQLTRSGNLQSVIETHVIQGDIDTSSVQDGDTATTDSGETIVFSVQDGQVTASVDGGSDSVVLGARQESCAGPVYIIDAPLRPKALAPAMAPVAPIPAPAPAPVPEAPAPAPETPAPAPAPESPAPAPETPAPAPVEEAPAPVLPLVVLPTPAPAEEPEMIAPEIDAPAPVLPLEPIEVPPAPVEVAPVPVEIAPEPMEIAPVPLLPLAPEPVEVAPAPAPILPLLPIAPVPVVPAPIAAAPREFVLPVDTPAPAPDTCETLADTLSQINPALLAAAEQVLPQQYIDVLNNPEANITILSPPVEDLQTLPANIDPEVLTEVILTHILVEPYTSEDLVLEGDGAELDTLNMEVSLELDLSEGVAFILGNTSATVIQPDYPSCASESSIHLIDTLLVPEGLIIDSTPDVLPPVEAPEDDSGTFSVASIVPAAAAAIATAAFLL